MGTTSAERMREYRKRWKAAAKASPDRTLKFIQGDFAEFVATSPLGKAAYLAASKAGVSIDWSDVSRAEAQAESMIQVAQELAKLINAFKREELTAALEREPSIKEAARIIITRDRLDRTTRISTLAMSVRTEE